MQDVNIAFISKSFTTMDIIPIAIHIPRRKIEPSIKLGIICIAIESVFGRYSVANMNAIEGSI